MTLQYSVHVAHVHLLSCCAGFEFRMPEWHTILDQLEIPDGAVAGLSASDKPVLRGKLLQLPAADRPFFFVGQPLDVLKTLRTLLPDAPSGQAQHLFNMISLRGCCSTLVHHGANSDHLKELHEELKTLTAPPGKCSADAVIADNGWSPTELAHKLHCRTKVLLQIPTTESAITLL